MLPRAAIRGGGAVAGRRHGPRRATLAALGARIESEAADRARDLGRGDEAAEAAARAADHAARAQAAIGRRSRVERAYAAEACAHASRARGGEPADELLAAVGLFEELSRPHPAATLLLVLAEEQLRDGDRDAAAGSAGEALESATAMGHAGLAAEARSFLGGHGCRCRRAATRTPTSRWRRSTTTRSPDPARARGAGMVAEGATNREIGEVLFMAEKTASVHVSRILAKLDVRSRTEAAAVAHRHGLARV